LSCAPATAKLRPNDEYLLPGRLGAAAGEHVSDTRASAPAVVPGRPKLHADNCALLPILRGAVVQRHVWANSTKFITITAMPGSACARPQQHMRAVTRLTARRLHLLRRPAAGTRWLLSDASTNTGARAGAGAGARARARAELRSNDEHLLSGRLGAAAGEHVSDASAATAAAAAAAANNVCSGLVTGTDARQLRVRQRQRTGQQPMPDIV
jgi:hypothetical protein